MYLPIFQTAGSVELAQSMFDEHVALYESEEDPARRMQHESALRRAISKDVTVTEALSEVWELGIWLVRQLLGPQHENDMARTVQVCFFVGGAGSGLGVVVFGGVSTTQWLLLALCFSLRGYVCLNNFDG